MALDTTQKQAVVFYLGYPGTTLVVGATAYNGMVAQRLTGLNEDIEDQVAALLTSIASTRTKLEASQGRMLVKKVGDIELNSDERMLLGRELKRLSMNLSTLLDIPMRNVSGNIINLVI